MITLRGKGVSRGIAIEKLVFFEPSAFTAERKIVSDTAGERERFNAARKTAGEQLDELSTVVVEKIGEKNALLFEIHRMMIDDPDFRDPIIKIIKNQRLCAEYAMMEAGIRLAQDFAEMDDEYMSERAADVRDVANRIIEILSGTRQRITAGPEPAVLVARDFGPSETVQFDRSKVLALVSQEGAANSHTAIFARTMGIPAIIGLGASLSPGLSGALAALDGETGELCITNLFI
ncbi:MAG: hypothetical protein LBT95_01080 [Treponema sp.]|jgi:phosphotransferase system enzyme I (PtsI)|nr:hypothetical protein [Treponema sp.]